MKKRAPRNRTLTCSQGEVEYYSGRICHARHLTPNADIRGKIIAGDTLETADQLPQCFVDLLILDPPYNLPKNFDGRLFI